MELTEQLAEEIGFDKSHITKEMINIFREDRMAKLREELGSNGDRPRLLT